MTPGAVDIEDVDIEVVRVALSLLGTHLSRCPPWRRSRCASPLRRRSNRPHHTRHPEIENLGLSRAVDQDVGRFQVSMDDILKVGMVHGLCDSRHEGHAVGEPNSTRGDVFIEWAGPPPPLPIT